MDVAIIASTFALGLAGAPHCTAMCAAPCAALSGRGDDPGATFAFHAARVAGYALAGGAAAAGLLTLGLLAQAQWLRPLWVLVHVGLLTLGVWLLWQGRQPAWLARLGRTAAPGAPAGPVVLMGGGAGGATVAGLGGGAAGLSVPAPRWEPVRLVPTGGAPQRGARRRAAAAGGLWFAWPCGLLQSALLVAALASSPVGGALSMAAFAAASSVGLLAGPFLWRRIGAGTPGGGASNAERWALRAAGAMMAGMSAWALGEGVWHRVVELCATL